MKKIVVPDKVVLDSKCGYLANHARSARTRWANFYSAIKACFIFDENKQQFLLDPFTLPDVIKDIRSDPLFLSQFDERKLIDIETWAHHEAETIFLSFDLNLRLLCTKNNTVIEGRFPHYIVENFLRVRIFEDNRTCMVGHHKIKSLLVSRIWKLIAIAIDAEKRRKIQPNVFLASCHAAYIRAVLLKNEELGSPIPIRDLYHELIIGFQPEKFWKFPNTINLVEYSEEYFCRDLAGLLNSTHLDTSSGKRMELMPTAFSKEGIPLELKEGTRFFGSVAFIDIER